MKAIIFEQAGNWQEVLQLKEITLAEPAADEIQVQVTARSINPSDEMFINGVYRKQPVLPQIAGLEGAGIIIKTGTAVDASLPGKQVSFRAPGAWAEKINLKPQQYNIVPNNVAPETASQLSLNTLTAYALLEETHVQKGDYLVMTAASGAVGQQLIQLAAIKGIHVIATARHDSDKDMLASLGASYIINTEKENLETCIKQLVPGGVRAAIDAIGGQIGTALYKIMAPFGKLIVYGRLSKEPVQYYNGDVTYRNLTIQGFGIDAWISSKREKQLETAWHEIIQAVSSGALKIGYDKKYQLINFDSAIAAYIFRAGKVLLT
jgi:NADPH2:quinone reductase